jgi:ribosomal protein S18 acetylase RimI-like enzyme
MSGQQIVIKEIKTAAAIQKSAQVVRNSFKTVAEEFSLTRRIAPTHPSFVTSKQLSEIKDRGLVFYGLFVNQLQVSRLKITRPQVARLQVGFVAIEAAADGVFYLEKLAVLPEYRHGGYGRLLVKKVVDYVRENHGTKVSLGMINEHTVLKNWYIGLGFKETGIKNFIHLPFTVCFMDRDLSPLD